MRINQLFFKYGVYYPIVFFRGERLSRYLERLERSQWFTVEGLRELQREKMAHLLKLTADRVPYYSRLTEELGLEGMNPLEAVLQYPLLTKSLLRERSDELRARGRHGPVTKKTTGGSTGQAVSVVKNRRATGQELAAQWRGWHWASVDIGERQARFWGIPFSAGAKLRARLIDLVANRKRCSAFAFGRDEMADYVRELNVFTPDYFYGYVSMMVEFAEYVRENRVTLAFQLKAIITTAEVLGENQRTTLQEVFGCPVYNEYGCGELGTIAHECPRGRMHINAENLLVEILSGGRACGPGEVGEMVITELNNTAMPLVRYRSGDYAAFDTEHCPCGRTLPVLKNIYGREYDLIYNREGKMFHGEFFMYIFEDVKRQGLGVRAFQLVQEDFDRFTVRIQPDESFGERTKEFITNRIRGSYGDYVTIDFECVERFRREPSGKLRLVKGLGSPRQISSTR